MREDFASNVSFWHNIVALVRDLTAILVVLITVLITWLGGNPSQLAVTDWAYLILSAFSVVVFPALIYFFFRWLLGLLHERLFRPDPEPCRESKDISTFRFSKNSVIVGYIRILHSQYLVTRKYVLPPLITILYLAVAGVVFYCVISKYVP